MAAKDKQRRGPKSGTSRPRHGGLALKLKYGPDYFAQIGKRGGQATKASQGPNYFRALGTKGGNATIRNHGSELFERLAEQSHAQGAERKIRLPDNVYELARWRVVREAAKRGEQ